MSEWISVDERLPFGYAIAYRPSAPTENRVATIKYDYHLGRWCGQYSVTHWMPLPPPPEDDK